MIKQQDKIRSTIRRLSPMDKQREALEILNAVTDQVQFEPNCISTRLYRGVDEARAILLDELWESSQDLMLHLKSDAYRNILLVIEMAVEPPDIRFETITHTGGVEIIEKARKHT